MHSVTEGHQRLFAIIDDGIAQAARLEEVLEDERRALETQDSDRLGTAADAKRVCVARLDALETERTKACLACGIAPDLSASSRQPPGPLIDRWQRYLSLAARCRDLNRTNGGIINLRRQQIAAALRIVSGTRSGTYGPTGGEAVLRSRRELTEI